MSERLSDFLGQSIPSDCIILCGAGISSAAPSNLKTVKSFLSDLHSQIDSKTGVERKLTDQAIWGNDLYAQLRFEQIVTCLSEIDPDLNCLDFLRIRMSKGSSISQPNFYHRNIAELIRNGANELYMLECIILIEGLSERACLKLREISAYIEKRRYQLFVETVECFCYAFEYEMPPLRIGLFARGHLRRAGLLQEALTA